jgi:hypothetical protein
VREKYCSGWKNKLNKTDYKPDVPAGPLSIIADIAVMFLEQGNI